MYLACDALHNGVLHSEQIFEFAVVTLGPEVRLILCLDELNGDSYTVRPAPNAALDKIVRIQLFTDFLGSQLASFVLCNRTAGYYGQLIPIQLSNLRDHFFSQAVTEEFLVGIVAQVLERQDSEDDLALGMSGGLDARRQPRQENRRHTTGSKANTPAENHLSPFRFPGPSAVPACVACSAVRS